MKSGNVTGNVYRRSVYQKLNPERKEKRAVSGENCAFFMPDSGARIAVAMDQTLYPGESGGKYAVYAAANQAAASGARKLSGILLRILLPEGAPEQALQSIAKGAKEAADRLGVSVLDTKAGVSFGVTAPLTSAVAFGEEAVFETKTARGGRGALPEDGEDAGRPARSEESGAAGCRQVVMTKWAGLEGSVLLADRCGETLRERYPAWLLDEARGLERYLSVQREAAAAGESGADALCAAAEGGIFHALWTLAQRAGVGLDIDLKRIPIRQETVEICNTLDLNPYELLANGSLLCLSARGEELVRIFLARGIPAAVIGIAVPGNDRVVRSGDEIRFLEPAREDEIFKIWKSME